MSPFIERCPDVAASEMVILRIVESGLSLPPGEYAFYEWFCTDDNCDCRRALLQVLSPQHQRGILATINYGWESAEFYTRWMHGDEEAGRDITSACLDPLNPQSDLADALLDGFRNYVRLDSTFPEQLRRHYELFKSTLPPAPAQPLPQSMTTDEILRQLQRIPRRADFAPYRAALLAARQQPAAITPALIAALDRVSANPAQYRKDYEECLHLFAICLLAEFRERTALDAFLRFFSLPGEDAMDFTGDMVTEQGAAVLASVCGGDPRPLLRLAYDEGVNDYVREAAILGLLVQSLWGERPREAVLDDLRGLFATLPRPGNAYVWAALVGALCDFHAPELLPQARECFAAELVDESIISLEDVEGALLQTGPYCYSTGEKRIQAFRERNAPIDAVAECSEWTCFHEDEENYGDFPPEEDEDDLDEDSEQFARVMAFGDKPYIAPPKVGRNDPCPCGSGKKFKKCCGNL
jgi:hypothetical protein